MDAVGIDPALPGVQAPREAPHEALQAARRTLAADLHDGLGSALTYAKFRLPLLADAIAAGDRGSAEHHLGALREALGQAQSTLRELLTHLRASADPQGLAHALAECAAQFRRQATVALDFCNEVPDLRLQPEQEAELVQLAREALSNIERHAGASHASLALRAAAGGVQLEVDDDGVGLAAGAGTQHGHHGLAIMRERAARLGATLRVESPAAGAGRGTRIVLELPLPARAA
jgi:two-component system nitrate/nitrite sensor histidine kinase NarX